MYIAMMMMLMLFCRWLMLLLVVTPLLVVGGCWGYLRCTSTKEDPVSEAKNDCSLKKVREGKYDSTSTYGWLDSCIHWTIQYQENAQPFRSCCVEC
jgi:hypothetical protein